MSTKDNIIKEALTVFAVHGYAGASLAAISTQVGIKKPSLYNYFDGKKELFVKAFESVINGYTVFMEEAYTSVRHRSAAEILKHLLFETCSYYVLNQHEAAMWKRALLFPHEDWESEITMLFVKSEQHTDAIINQVFQKGIASGEVKPADLNELRQAYYCLLDGLFLQMSYYPQESFEERRQNVWRIFWSGIEATGKKEEA